MKFLKEKMTTVREIVYTPKEHLQYKIIANFFGLRPCLIGLLLAKKFFL